MRESIETAKRNYMESHGFEEMHLKAVLFDMDGVLFDSMPNHAASWSAVMTEFGLEMTPEEAYMHEGRTGADTIHILARRHWGREATEDEIRSIYEAKCRAFNGCTEPPRMPGAAEVLQKVAADGCRIVLVTGSGQRSLLDRLEHNFPHTFAPDNMVTSFDVEHGKPHPEPYLRGLARAGVRPWEAMVVENAPLGVRAGVAAGIFTLAVNTGPLDDRVLLDAGADWLFPSMQALADGWAGFFEALR